ncbi:hypothetical protein, partial [Paenibacillus sp. P22]|uniref:hypothetical protein n=1 Tax=Paenibacillus sp. P22 TaxID=483908 RepID=UPI001E578B8F
MDGSPGCRKQSGRSQRRQGLRNDVCGRQQRPSRGARGAWERPYGQGTRSATGLFRLRQLAGPKPTHGIVETGDRFLEDGARTRYQMFLMITGTAGGSNENHRQQC